MTAIGERRQRLDFDETWTVVKWDERDEFTTGIRGALHQTLDGVKGADVAGVREPAGGATVTLVAEFKDFDHPDVPANAAAETVRRATSDRVMEDLVRKVIDTLCGVTFSHDKDHRRGPELSRWRPTLGSATATRLLVLFCIETPPASAARLGPWTKELQKRLRWLGPNAQILVTSSAAPFEGAGIRYRVT